MSDTSTPPKGELKGFSGDRRLGFTETESLSTFAQRFVERELWTSLVEAVRETMGDVAHRPSGIVMVVADDPLLGLAATALFARPDIQVPLFDRQRRRLERLAEAVNIHPLLRDFVRDSGNLPGSSGPLLMLTWNNPYLLARADKRLVDLGGSAALRNGLVCLCSRRQPPAVAPGAAADAVAVVDVSDSAASIVAATIRRLELPRRLHLAQPEEAERLLTKLSAQGFALERVINALNTPSHGDFLWFVQQMESGDRPQVTKVFDDCVLSASEDRPRHAASLFLVSHFSRLSPRQFIELGDALSLVTPASRPRRDHARAPDLMTDQVLKECGIAFTPTPQGDAFASLVLHTGRADEDTSTGPERTQHMRLQFETRAPLLSERYLRHLGDHLMLGHPSWNVARDYIRHEALALKAAAESDEQVSLTDRLRRAVYGNVSGAGIHAGQDADAAKDRLRRVERFVRALDRVPALLEEFAGTSLDDRLVGAVRALCSEDPSRSGFVSEEISRYGSAWLFWCLYAQYPGKVTLRDFPSFFQRDAAGSPWRVDSLRILHDIFAPAEGASDHRQLDRFARPELLVLLIEDIVRHRDRLVDDLPETCRSSLLAETWISYLRKNLRGVPWNQVLGWQAALRPFDELATDRGDEPIDLQLAKLLTAHAAYGTADQWIRLSRYRGSHDEDATRQAANHLEANAYALFELAPLLIDAVVGCAAFEDTEVTALEIWLLAAMGLPDEAWAELIFGDRRLWLPYAMTGTVEDEDPVRTAFQQAMDPVFAMFPVVALMAATHVAPEPPAATAGFVFSAALRDWLAEIPRHSDASPAQQLLDQVQICLEFQRTWRKAHDHIRLHDVDWREISDLMADRTGALNAFAATLEPIARASRPGALPSRSKANVAGAPAPTPSPAAQVSPAPGPPGKT